jgi:tetratricopeptide (TPR) repeat protein
LISNPFEVFIQAMNLNPKLISSANDLHQRSKAVSMPPTYYQERLTAAPSDAEVYFSLADISRHKLNSMEALSYCQKGIELQPDFAVGYAKLGQLTEAAMCLQRAIAVEPSFSPALNFLLKVELQHGNIPATFDPADQSKALDYESPERFAAIQNYRK